MERYHSTENLGGEGTACLSKALAVARCHRNGLCHLGIHMPSLRTCSRSRHGEGRLGFLTLANPFTTGLAGIVGICRASLGSQTPLCNDPRKSGQKP